MKIAFIADGRAEHARRWIRYFDSTGDDVLLLSTFPCEWNLKNVTYLPLPGIFRPGNAFVKSSEDSQDSSSAMKLLVRLGVDSTVRPLWNRLNVLDVVWQARAARAKLLEFQPDIVHALRIPNESYIASFANVQPWVISVWGQDFIHHMKYFWVHRWLTKKTLRSGPAALTADCQRDISLAADLGLPASALTRFFPGNGGVDFSIFNPGVPAAERRPKIVYARGFGPYLRFDTLLSAFKLVCDDYAPATLLLLALPAQLPRFRALVQSFKIPGERCEVIPFQDKQSWSTILKTSAIFVSPSMSDGTPNGMLEAMACGTYPVMGRISSIEEWICHGENGMLFDPNNPDELAACLRSAVESASLREEAARHNYALVKNRADYNQVMPQVRDFYQEVSKHYATKHGDDE